MEVWINYQINGALSAGIEKTSTGILMIQQEFSIRSEFFPRANSMNHAKLRTLLHIYTEIFGVE